MIARLRQVDKRAAEQEFVPHSIGKTLVLACFMGWPFDPYMDHRVKI